MKRRFVHLSDIHFGQETGGQLVVHADIRDRLVEDVSRLFAKQIGERADGIIVSGDIAYAGKAVEYKAAGEWLDKVAYAVGCPITSIQLVPGNHDIDRDQISIASELMLEKVAKEGDSALDKILDSDPDRELLYARFGAYRPFAEAYRSPLDNGGGLAGDRSVDVSPTNVLRFIGLNTALICSKKDHPGRLLLGARQRVLPSGACQELVVVGHHPLHWLQDSEDARRYIRTRARVFISGHEHKPSAHVETIEKGRDLLIIAAGATTPPGSGHGFGYSYNVLEFEWLAALGKLEVTVHPRVWSEEKKCFVPDSVRFAERLSFQLGCPNYGHVDSGGQQAPAPTTTGALEEKMSAKEEEKEKEKEKDDGFALVLLRFFRDLTPVQRLRVLVSLKQLPDDWSEPTSHSIERRALDVLRKMGRLQELQDAIHKAQKE